MRVGCNKANRRRRSLTRARLPETWSDQGIMGRKRSKRPARKVGFWRRWSGLLWKLALVGVVALAGLVIYLDAVIQEKFSR